MKEERLKELQEIRKLIKKYIKSADCGIFDCRNYVGDPMSTLFDGKYLILDICVSWAYFEVFGTTKEEFKQLKEYYEQCGGMVWEKKIKQ